MKVLKRLSESTRQLCIAFALHFSLVEALKLLEIKGHMTEHVYGNLSKLTITVVWVSEDGPSGCISYAVSFK